MNDETPVLDLSQWRTREVTGADATDWLEDLISASLRGMDKEGSRRSLLLTPTGRIRADFYVTLRDDGFLLIQDPVQPKPIDELLAPYVLSSDVKLAPPSLLSIGHPKVHGDVLQLAWGTTHWPPRVSSIDEFDVWRIHRGMPRFGIDLDEDSLPQEAGWERFIDFTKGCFMGQEAMAKIRNMGGHPTRVVEALRAAEPVSVGEPVHADGREVGIITSAAGPTVPVGVGTDVIVRVSWNARGADLRTSGGVALSDRA